MFRLTQIIRNSFIRLEGIFSQLFGFIRKLLSQIFTFLGRIFGFSKLGYFLEDDDARGIKSTKVQTPTETEPKKITPETPVSYRRRPDPKMDYFRKMAQDVTQK